MRAWGNPSQETPATVVEAAVAGHSPRAREFGAGDDCRAPRRVAVSKIFVVNNISDGSPGMAVMSEEVARCPQCGTIKGGAPAALDALYGEVARLRQLAERLPRAARPDAEQERALHEARARETQMRREIRLLQETVARLRGGIVTLQRLDMLCLSPTMSRHFHTERGRRFA